MRRPFVRLESFCVPPHCSFDLCFFVHFFWSREQTTPRRALTSAPWRKMRFPQARITGVTNSKLVRLKIKRLIHITARTFAATITRSAFLAWIVLAASASPLPGQSIRVHLWVKVFIPKTHPTNPGYVKPVPGAPGKWMIPGPTPLDQCFFTDHRDFSSEKSASARVTTEFFLVINGNSASTTAPAPHIHTAGISTKVNCSTGSVIGQKPGVFSRLHSIGSTAPEDSIGKPVVAGTQVQVIFGVATTNPFAPAGISPATTASTTHTIRILRSLLSRRMWATSPRTKHMRNSATVLWLQYSARHPWPTLSGDYTISEPD